MEDAANDILGDLIAALPSDALVEITKLGMWLAAFAYIVVRITPPVLSFVRAWYRDREELDIQRRAMDHPELRRHSSSKSAGKDNGSGQKESDGHD